MVTGQVLVTCPSLVTVTVYSPLLNPVMLYSPLLSVVPMVSVGPFNRIVAPCNIPFGPVTCP